MVWPAIKLASRAFHGQPHPDDVLDRLLRIRATTRRAKPKEAAILALDDAAWCYLRDDSIETMHSLLRDVAGIETHNLGADVATPTR